jgi:hypothetical protein
VIIINTAIINKKENDPLSATLYKKFPNAFASFLLNNPIASELAQKIPQKRDSTLLP